MNKRTNNRLVSILAGLLLVFGSLGTANADGITRFDFLADNLGGGPDLTGYIVVNSADIGDGNAVCAYTAGGCAGVMIDWHFNFAGPPFGGFDFQSDGTPLKLDSPNWAPGKHFVKFDAAGGITSWEIAVHDASGTTGLSFNNDGFYSKSSTNLLRIVDGATGDSEDLNVTQAWTEVPAIPTPEPSTLLLLASGLAGLAWLRRRKAAY